MKTYTAKPSDIEKNWLLIDAKDLKLGRLASQVARLLIGKHKPTFTPHMDCGDNVVVINAKKVKFTGIKADRNVGKKYYHHTGFPGGIKERTAGKILEGKNPEQVLEKAITRMMPGGPLSRAQLKNLYIYAGDEHQQEAQKPQKLDVASMNKKNSITNKSES